METRGILFLRLNVSLQRLAIYSMVRNYVFRMGNLQRIPLPKEPEVRVGILGFSTDNHTWDGDFSSSLPSPFENLHMVPRVGGGGHMLPVQYSFSETRQPSRFCDIVESYGCKLEYCIFLSKGWYVQWFLKHFCARDQNIVVHLRCCDKEFYMNVNFVINYLKLPQMGCLQVKYCNIKFHVHKNG